MDHLSSAKVFFIGVGFIAIGLAMYVALHPPTSDSTHATSAAQVPDSGYMRFQAAPFSEKGSLSVWFFAAFPGGTNNGHIYSVEFGDGSSATMEWKNGKGTDTAWALSVSHKYAIRGTYTAKLVEEIKGMRASG